MITLKMKNLQNLFFLNLDWGLGRFLILNILALLTDAKEMKTDMAMVERVGGMQPYRLTFGSMTQELDRIRLLGFGIVPTGDLDGVVSSAKKEIDVYTQCLDKAADTFGATKKEKFCSDNFDEVKVQKVGEFFSVWLRKANQVKLSNY